MTVNDYPGMGSVVLSPAVTTTAETMNAKESRDLEQVRLLTQMMREHERQIVALGKKRRRLLRAMRERRVPYRLLADAMGTTEQAVYKDLRWGG